MAKIPTTMIDALLGGSDFFEIANTFQGWGVIQNLIISGDGQPFSPRQGVSDACTGQPFGDIISNNAGIELGTASRSV